MTSDEIVPSPGRRGISHLLRQGTEIEILECDKTGHIQHTWIHTADGKIEKVQQTLITRSQDHS
jgi:hypothetical protein